MSCEETLAHLSAAVDGEPLTPELESGVAEHLEGCSACARGARELSSMHRLLLESRAEEMIDPGRSVRSHTPRRLRRIRPAAERSFGMPVLAAAAAAAALVIGAVLLAVGSPRTETPERRVAPPPISTVRAHEPEPLQAKPGTGESRPLPTEEPRDSAPNLPKLRPPTKAKPGETVPRGERKRLIERRMREEIEKQKERRPEPRTEPRKPVPPGTGRTVTTVAVLKRAGGTVSVRRGGENVPAREGQELHAGQGLEVGGVPGEAVVEYADGTRLVLGPDTIVQKLDLGEGAGKSLWLEKGTLTAEVVRQPQGRPMVLFTPQAEATVLGTTLILSAGARSTRLEVTEGKVRLTRSKDKKSVLVSKGHFAVSAPSGVLRAHPSVRALYVLPGVDRQGIVLDTFKPEVRPAAGSLSGRPVYSRAHLYEGGTYSALNGPKPAGGALRIALDLPRPGRWYVWARHYYPGDAGMALAGKKDNGPNSFWVDLDGGTPLILGNIRPRTTATASLYRVWHWDGGDASLRKAGDTSRDPMALYLGRLGAGKHTLTIRPRETYEVPGKSLSPRIDVLCITDDPGFVPTDAHARKALKARRSSR